MYPPNGTFSQNHQGAFYWQENVLEVQKYYYKLQQDTWSIDEESSQKVKNDNFDFLPKIAYISKAKSSLMVPFPILYPKYFIFLKGSGLFKILTWIFFFLNFQPGMTYEVGPFCEESCRKWFSERVKIGFDNNVQI